MFWPGWDNGSFAVLDEYGWLSRWVSLLVLTIACTDWIVVVEAPSEKLFTHGPFDDHSLTHHAEHTAAQGRLSHD